MFTLFCFVCFMVFSVWLMFHYNTVIDLLFFNIINPVVNIVVWICAVGWASFIALSVNMIFTGEF